MHMAETHETSHRHRIWKLSKAQREEIAKSSRRIQLSADEEFEHAFKMLTKYPKRVTIFGSARSTPRFKAYRQARELAGMLSHEGYAIISGGGSGIMEASNRGAFDEQDVSIGFNIKLPHEQVLNPYTSEHLTFNYFFTRKVMMTFYTHGIICFPGGFGTLDEFFEIITLIQTGKMPKVPVVLVGRKFWKPLDRFIKQHLLKTGLISHGDNNIYFITDNLKTAKKHIVENFDKTI